MNAEVKQNWLNVPVDLKTAPVTAPAPMLPRISCLPLAASIEELTPLYTSAEFGKSERNYCHINFETYQEHLQSYQRKYLV